MSNNVTTSSQHALMMLLHKYAVQTDRPVYLDANKHANALLLLQGWKVVQVQLTDAMVPLSPWRSRRSFVELRKIVTENMLDCPRLFRFSCMTNKLNWSLRDLMYRELDLFEYISNDRVASIYAVISPDVSANLLVTTERGLLCSIELSVQLPEENKVLERHEIIAKRGIACDLSVDTQVPQSSIYCYTTDGNKQFTDTDAELFGFDDITQDHIRAAFEFLRDRQSSSEYVDRHQHILKLIDAAFDSARQRKKIKLN